DETILNSNSQISARVATFNGGSWLSVLLDGAGSFRFVLPYKVTARHISGMNEGDYLGSITTTGSSLPADNKLVNVTFRVTSQPLLRASPDTLRVRIAQNVTRTVKFIDLSNRGLGTLSFTAVTANITTGAGWLTAEKIADADLVSLAFNTTGLAPGVYLATVGFTSNAINNPSVIVPVTLEVVAQAAPLAFTDGVVSNATFEGGDTLAKGLIAAVFGEQFLLGDPVSASSLPLGTDLGGVRVFVADRPAPVYYASYDQVNFQIPYDAPAGQEVLVRVERAGQRGNSVAVRIVDSAPRILRLRIADYGILVNQDGTFPIPPTPGLPSRRARTGDVLVGYVLGGGPTAPPVQSGVGAPSSTLAMVPAQFRAVFGAGVVGTQTVPVQLLFFGRTPNFVGLYQVNFPITDAVPRGNAVPLTLEGPAGIRSNTVTIAVV
ncbi:MAG: hypothetical protein ACRD44_14915, partial [Bryobacteraceae bacterium]